MKWKFYFTVLKLGIIILTPITFLILPADFFDHGESVCLSVLLFHRQCYACGMTRACQHLIHLDFEDAYVYNMLSFVVLPLLAVVWIQWFIKEWKTYKKLRPAIQQS